MAKVKKSGKRETGGRDVRRTAQSADERGGKTASKSVKAATKGASMRPSAARPKAAKPAKAGSRKPTTAKRATPKTAKKAAAKKAAAKKAAVRKSVARKAAARTAAPAKRSTAAGRSAKQQGSKGRRPVLRLVRGGAKPEPEVQIRIRELDPLQKCGAATSVERLIRVDEIVGKALTAHLVFLDHHGWYCEHGQGCFAVSHARKHAQQVVRSPHDRNGTHNGRMRA